MERPGGLGGSQEAAARDLADVPRLIAEAAAAQNDEDLRDAPSHRQQRTPRSSPQKSPRQTPKAAPHGRRRTEGPGAPGALESFSSPGANSLHDALDDDDATDLTGQVQVEQEQRATTSEGRLRLEDAEARDQDGDHPIEEAPPAEAAPAAAPAAASTLSDEDLRLLKRLEKYGTTKPKGSLKNLKAAAKRHDLVVPTKGSSPNACDYAKALLAHLQALKPDSSSSDDEDGIVPGARVRTLTHGAGTVLEGRASNSWLRVQLDEPCEYKPGDFRRELAIPKAQLTRLAPGDVGYEAPSTTGAAGSGAAAVHALKIKTVLEDPSQHALGFAAPEQVVAPRATPTLVVPRPLLATRDPNVALGRAADDAFRALREHGSLLDSLKETLNQKEAEAEDFGRREKDRKEAHVKDAREAYAAEAAKGPRLKDAFAEASRALDAATVSFCPALEDLIRSNVDPLRAVEAEDAALRQRVGVQLTHSESADAKKLGELRHPLSGSVLYDVAPRDGTPPRGVLALQCPRENCLRRCGERLE